MDLYHKILIGVSAGLLLLGGFIGYQWLQAHDAAIRAEAKVAADQASFDKLSTQQKDLNDQLAQLKKDQTDQLATNSKNFNQAQSPQQLAVLIAQLMGLKQPPVVITPAATAANPNPSPILELPDAPQVKTYFKECEDCKIERASLIKQAAVATADKQLAEQKLQLKTDESDTWKQLANGGSWKKRAGNRVKDFIVDAGITALLVCGSGHCK